MLQNFSVGVHVSNPVKREGHTSNGNIFRVTGPLRGEFIIGEFPSQKLVTWSFDVFSDLSLNKRLSEQSWGWWFEAPIVTSL